MNNCIYKWPLLLLILFVAGSVFVSCSKDNEADSPETETDGGQEGGEQVRSNPLVGTWTVCEYEDDYTGYDYGYFYYSELTFNNNSTGSIKTILRGSDGSKTETNAKFQYLLTDDKSLEGGIELTITSLSSNDRSVNKYLSVGDLIDSDYVISNTFNTLEIKGIYSLAWYMQAVFCYHEKTSKSSEGSIEPGLYVCIDQSFGIQHLKEYEAFGNWTGYQKACRMYLNIGLCSWGYPVLKVEPGNIVSPLPVFMSSSRPSSSETTVVGRYDNYYLYVDDNYLAPYGSSQWKFGDGSSYTYENGAIVYSYQEKKVVYEKID